MSAEEAQFPTIAELAGGYRQVLASLPTIKLQQGGHKIYPGLPDP